jgi:hypothetical protein
MELEETEVASKTTAWDTVVEMVRIGDRLWRVRRHVIDDGISGEHYFTTLEEAMVAFERMS